MKYVNYRVNCKGKELDTYAALVNPFIAFRIWKRSPFRVKLLKCGKCGFVFFNLRPDEEDFAVLYSGYRDYEYQKQRQSFENWYTKEFNDQVGKNPIEVNNRKANFIKILKEQNVAMDRIGNALDWGGDKGQFIPDEFVNAKKYVYELSGIEAQRGIKMIKKLSDIQDLKFDFVLCNHVLEHVSYPSKILDNMKIISHKKTLFYFEVPLEDYLIPSKTGFKKKIKFIFRSLLGEKLNNYLANYIYKYLHRKIWDFSAVMSEHINYFTVESLKNMLEYQGFKIKFIGTALIDMGTHKNDVICCLAEQD